MSLFPQPLPMLSCFAFPFHSLTSFYSSQSDLSSYLLLSITFILLASFVYGLTGITAKIADYFYEAFLEEYSMVFMIITGFLGTLFGLGIVYFEIPMDAPPDSSMLLSVAGASAAGIIQSTGVMLVFKSFQYGSLEVMYLFMNMRVLVQIVEEFILFQILPSFISSVGMIVALSGASIMIIFDQRDHRKFEKQDKSY